MNEIIFRIYGDKLCHIISNSYRFAQEKFFLTFVIYIALYNQMQRNLEKEKDTFWTNKYVQLEIHFSFMDDWSLRPIRFIQVTMIW